jgi:RNA polymerase sigma-70 factor (ECF subfamily)
MLELTEPEGAPGALAEAMVGYLDGDPRAYARLHRLLAPRLGRLLRRLTRDGDVAEDLAQVTLLKGHLARERFFFSGAPEDRAVLAWYFSIARNTGLDYLRQRSRQARGGGFEGHEGGAERAWEEIADPESGIEAVVIAREEEASIIARVQAALAALPAGQREVVELHKLQGMSMAEVAERLAIREGAVRVRAHRAYKALAAWLTPVASFMGLIGGGS